MAYINIAEWTPEHVADWLRGVDNIIIPYVHFFLNKRIDGHQLLQLGPDDLLRLNILKIGHQELILEAVSHLRRLHYNLITENLQSLALKVGCHARSLHNEIQIQILTKRSDPAANKVSTEILASAADLINAVKEFISWIDRPPFRGQEQYYKMRKSVLQFSLELASTAQRDHFAENPLELIRQKCLCLADISDFVVQEYTDALIIQPASLEVVTARKAREEDDWGMQITSKYSGVHIVASVKFQSPVQLCAKVEEGDEIVQINYQTVLGWNLDHLLYLLQDKATEVTLTLKKRPRHSNLLGQMICLKPYKIPAKKSYDKKQHIPEEGFPKRVEPEPSSPRVLREVEADDDAFLPETSNEDKGISDHVVVSRLRSQVKSKRATIQRRATVSGASPTVTNPPVSFEDLVDGQGEAFVNDPRHKKSSCARDHVTRSISHDPCCKNPQLSPPSQFGTSGDQKLIIPTLVLPPKPLPQMSLEPRKSAVPAAANLPSPLKKVCADRAVSSESLVPADFQGWMYVRPKRCPNKWHKRWAMLKHSYLYLFKSRHETKAVCLIFLPGFSITTDDNVLTKKFAFKLEHPTVTFNLACSEESDMQLWRQRIDECTGHVDTVVAEVQRSSVMPDRTVYFSESEESNPDSGEEGNEMRSGTRKVIHAEHPPLCRTGPKPKPRAIFLASTLPGSSSSPQVTPGTPTKPSRNRNSSPQQDFHKWNDCSSTLPPNRSTPSRSPAPDITEGMFKKAQQQQAERNKLKHCTRNVDGSSCCGSSPPPSGPLTPPAVPPRCATSQQIKELYFQRTNWGSSTKLNEDQTDLYATRIESSGSPKSVHRSPPPLPPNKPDILAGTQDHDKPPRQR